MDNVVNFIAVGDVTLGDHPVCFGHGVRSTIEKRGFGFLFENIEKELSGADILFGNLETVLTSDAADTRRMDAAEFRGKTVYAKKLSETGFNVMSIANNHAMQHGVDAFDDSIEALKTSSISAIGIAENGVSNVSYHESGNVKIAMVAYSLRPDDYTDTGIKYAMGDEGIIREQVFKLKKEGCIVILSLHWGEEYLNHPSDEQVCLAHELVEAGADLILGHHPHVLQGVERYKSGYIVYSMGNFIADFWQEYARKSMIFKCTLTREGVGNVECVPVMINRRFQPRVPDDDESKFILGELNEYQSRIPKCKSGGLKEERDVYQQLAEKAYLKYRKECYLYFLRNLYRYSFSTIAFSGVRFMARRLGFG